MKLSSLVGLAAVVILNSAALAGCQTVVQPAMPRGSIANVQDTHDRTMNRLWIASILSIAGASGLDAASSWGKYEGNSLLASPDGRFGVKGVSIKAGLGAAAVIPEILLRKHKGLKARLALTNFAEAGVFTGIAIRNFGIPAPPR